MPAKYGHAFSRRRYYRKFLLAAALMALLLLVPAMGLCASCETVRVTYVYSPLCTICEHSGPSIRAAVNDSMSAGIDVRYEEHMFSSREGRADMERYGLSSVPAVIVNGRAIRPGDFDGDTKKLESLLRRAISDACHYKTPVTLERKIVKVAEKDTVSVVTIIANSGTEPVYATIRGGTCEGVSVVEGETSWEGTVMPGERQYLAYEADISRNVRSLPPQALTYSDSLGEHSVSCPETPVFILKKLSVAAVFIAGLVAGFNPCLLAVMAFVSAMALSMKGRRLDIIFNLLAFSAGLLCIYLLMGIGFLRLIESVPSLTSALKTAIIVLLAGLAGFAFYEAWQVKKDPDRASLFKSFVDRYKPLYKKYCLPASFGLGGAFGLIKMPCVGGIYVGILGAIAGSGEAGRGLLLLVAYNFGVVLPVLALGALLVLGMSPEKVDRLRKKHRYALKLATGLILATMAAGFMLNVI
ncbi:cytochrome c biogenesis protein [Methanocella paludicola]|nr:cytochrome c biogenesis protein [Methanocella paludicola]